MPPRTRPQSRAADRRRFGITHWTFGVTYLAMGRHREAVASLEQAAQLTRSPNIVATLAHATARSGDRPAAERMMASLRESASHVSPFPLAIGCVGLGRHDEALAWLEGAFDERDGWMTYLNVYPIFDPLRADARFTALVRRVGLPADGSMSPPPSRGGISPVPGSRAR
jgi:hypothetical protein